MKRYLLYALMALSITACKKDPDNVDIPDGPVSTVLQEVTFDKMPATGDPVYGMDMNASGIVACSFGGKLYVSDASGENWTLINDTDYHYKMIFCNDGSLLVVTNNGLKRYSTSWVKTDITATLGAAEWTRFCKSNTGVYYLSPGVLNSSATNVYYSTNSGDNWTAIPAPNTGSSYGIYGFGVTADDKLSVVSFQYFARTTNMGQNWAVTTRQFPTAMNGNYVYEASNGNIFLYGMATSNAYLVSTDGGADFSEIDLYNNVGMTSIWEKDGKLYCSLYDHEGRKGAGIYESNDGGSTSNGWVMKFPCWPQIVKTNGSRWVYAEATNPTFGYMCRRGLGISNDNAATWYTTGPDELPNHIQDFEFDNDGTLLIAMNGALYKRINDKWQLLGAPGGGSSNLNTVTDNPGRNRLTKTPNGDIVYLHGGAHNGGALAAMRLKPNGTMQFLQYIGAVTPLSPVGVTSLGGAAYWNNNDVIIPGSSGALMQIRCLKADMSSCEKVSGGRWVSITGNGYNVYGINDDGYGESSMDGGINVSAATGLAAWPVAFKTTDVYFGYKNFQYYITNANGSSKAEVTFGQELNPGVILKGKFAPDGKLWLLNEVNPGGVYTLFKTDKAL